ncbi:hypothetical protein IF1G_01308 [Cordyceps javanica]|uniref:Uncharacterized protein n=1 Tax=Cordyceps javanica TaxID=43265 RepID=A0A545VBN5_9HYPO|nr:hypothetical protein IF1G_01308 [Cordyceps javanica]
MFMMLLFPLRSLKPFRFQPSCSVHDKASWKSFVGLMTSLAIPSDLHFTMPWKAKNLLPLRSTRIGGARQGATCWFGCGNVGRRYWCQRCTRAGRMLPVDSHKHSRTMFDTM